MGSCLLHCRTTSKRCINPKLRRRGLLGCWVPTNRAEAFSDGVFAIALTLLVLDLRPPQEGRFAEQLLDEWPAHLAYLTAFLTIATIWLNHHALFSRVKTLDPTALVFNLGLLLSASLVPWPTSLISAAVRYATPGDETAAAIVYAVLTVLIAVPWITLNLHLARRHELLESPTGGHWLRRNAALSASSLVLAAAGAGLALLSPLAALLLFLIAPLAFLAANFRAASHPATL